MNNFKIGDVVKHRQYGVGVIKRDIGFGYAVEFIKGSRMMHDCGGLCEKNHGYYIYKDDIVLNIELIVGYEKAYRINTTNNTKIPQIITEVAINGNSARTVCDESEFNEKTGILIACAKTTIDEPANKLLYDIALETWDNPFSIVIIKKLADLACGGSFEKLYHKWQKDKEFHNNKLRICHVCGKKFDTEEEARNHECWHVENKKRKHEKYIIRKEAKKRIAELEKESKINDMIKEMTDDEV